MGDSEKGLASMGFPPLMYASLALIGGVVLASFVLGPSGMSQLQSVTMDLLGLFDIIAGMDQAAIDSALATSYAISCTSIMNVQAPSDATLDAYAGEPGDAGAQALAAERIEEYWYNKSATPIVGETCNQSVTEDGVEFGVTNVSVHCDDFVKGGGCEVKGFTLPQKRINDGWISWIVSRGHPEHILYYQALPKGVDESWTNLGDRYNSMGIAVSAGVSVATPALFKAAKVFVGGATGVAKVGRSAKVFASGLRNNPAKIAYYAGSATTTVANPRAAAKYAGRMAMNYVRSLPARAMTSWHRIFARDISTYAVGYAKNAPTRINRDMVEEAVEQTSRSLRSTGFKDLDQAALRSEVAESLSETALRTEVTDEGIEKISRVMARRWQAAGRQTAEEFADQATQQSVRRSVTSEGVQKLAFRQNEFQEQAFRRIGMADKLLGQTNKEIVDQVTSLSVKGDMLEPMVNKGLNSISHAAKISKRAVDPAVLKRQGIRTACGSSLFRVGMFEGAMQLMDSSQDIANEHDGVSQAYAEDMQRLEEGDIESESGLNYPEGLGHCLAYTGLTAGQASKRMCGRVGVGTPPRLTSGTSGLYAQAKGAQACAAITMVGVTADQMMQEQTPFMPQESNSLQLYNPAYGTMEFPLNRFANFYFMALNKQNVGITKQAKERFYLVSPVETSKGKLATDQEGGVVIEPGGITQRLAGKQRAEKGDNDPCNAIDQFKEFMKENIEEVAVAGLMPVGGVIGAMAFIGVASGGLPNIIEGQEISVNRSWAEEEYNAKGSFFESGICPNNIVYTDLPIVGKEVIMDSEYELANTVYHEQMQDESNEQQVVTAPPGYKEAAPSESFQAQFDDTPTTDNLTEYQEDWLDIEYRWSSFIPMTQPIDIGQNVTDFKQTGDWLRPDEIDDHNVNVKEVADVGAIFDLGSTDFTLIQEDFISFTVNVDAEITLYYPCLSGICDKDVNIDWSESFDWPDDPLVLSLDDIPGELPTPQISVENVADIYTGDDFDVTNVDLTFSWEISTDDFAEWVREDLPSRDISVPETDIGITIPNDLLGDCCIEVGFGVTTVNEEPDDDAEYDGVAEFYFFNAIGPEENWTLPGGNEVNLRLEHNVTATMDYKYNTGWVPRKYISQHGEGFDAYKPPPGVVGTTVDYIDSDRTMNYFVNALDIRLDKGGQGNFKYIPQFGGYADDNGDPLYGYDASDGGGGSIAIYLFGGVIEMIVYSAMGACTVGIVTAAICYPIGGMILGGLGAVTEMAAQTYKNGCNWPIHGCERGFIESSFMTFETIGGMTIEAVTGVSDTVGEIASAGASKAAGIVGASVSDDFDWGTDIIDGFFSPNNENNEDEEEDTTEPFYEDEEEFAEPYG